jgi:hypothetical protein
MAKLSSVNRERLAVGFEEEFSSLKHPNSPSEESKLRDTEVSSTENMLAAACVEFRTEIGEEVEGPSMWVGRSLNMVGGRTQLAIGSQGWQDLKAVLLWS